MHPSEERADGYVGGIVDFCNGLSTVPLRGTQRDDLLSGLGVTGFGWRVTIAFIVTAEAVPIEGIFYGGQDLEAEFRDREIYLRGLAYRFSRGQCEGGKGKSGGSATGCLGNGYFRLTRWLMLCRSMSRPRYGCASSGTGPAQEKRNTRLPNGKEAMRRSAKEQIFTCARFDLFSGQDIF
jgi:toxin ParE1/3/4